MVLKTCEKCGKDFEPNKHTPTIQRFCSSKCRNHPDRTRAYNRAYYKKNQKKMRAYYRAYYKKNREKLNASYKAYRERNREKVAARDRERGRKGGQYLSSILAERGCKICGEKKVHRLIFHHRDPAKKSFTVAGARNYSRKRKDAEIAKCDVLCLNHHADAHLELRRGEKNGEAEKTG